MRFDHAVASIVLAAAAALSTPAAFAAVQAQGSGAAAAAGATAQPALGFEFSADYDLIALDLRFEYDATELSFDEAASKVTLDGQTRSLTEFLSFLSSSGGSVFKNYSVDGTTGLNFGAYSFASVDGLLISDELLFQPVFRLAADLPLNSQSQVRFVGELADESATTSGDAYDLTVDVTAVPEPQSWALMLAGLALSGAVVRRRG